MPLEQLANDAATTLAGGVAEAQTTITVASRNGFPEIAVFRVRIDDELLLITAGADTTTWTVERGIEGTLARSHSSGVPVTHVLTAGGLEAFVNENAASLTVEQFTITLANGATSSPQDRAVDVEGKAWAVVRKRLVEGGNLEGYWPFSENTGTTVADASGKGRHLTLNAAGWGAGAAGAGMATTGTQWGTRAGFPYPASNSSVSLWVKTSTADKIPFAHGFAAGTRGMYIHLMDSSTLNVQFFSASGVLSSFTASATLLDDQWHHIVVTQGGSTVLFYIDGSLVSTSRSDTGGGFGGNIGGTDTLCVGKAYFGNEFVGSIDEVRVFGRVLTVDEVITLYGAGAPGSLPNVDTQLSDDQCEIQFPTTSTVTVKNNTGDDDTLYLRVYTP